MKKVLFITTISGFLPQFERNDVRLLKEMGCEIHYASNFSNPVYHFDVEKLKDDKIRIHHINIEKSPLKIRKNVSAIRQLASIIDENKIDMIHCHNPMGGVAGRLAACFCKRKPYVIYTAHGFHFYKGAPILNWFLFFPIEYMLAMLTDQLITINREDYKLAKKFPLRSKDGVTLIHSVGVDKKRFFPQKEIRELKRQELNVPKNAFHIVTVAELNVNKNQKVIIEALAKINNKDIYYSICGKGNNEKQLNELIYKYKLEDRVRLLGYRTDVAEILQTADCFAFPSFREGLGVAAIEALLCNVPLIVADNRGTREYSINGVNSIVCKPGAVDEFAEAIEVLYRDSAKRTKMTLRYRKTAEKFAIENVEKTMKEVYTKWINH